MIFRYICNYISRWFFRYWYCILLGLGLSFSFPPFYTGFLAYGGLIPVLYWSTHGSLRNAFNCGYWWGFGFVVGALYWIINSTLLGAVMSFWFLPYFNAATVLLCRWLYRRYGGFFFIVFPFIWTAIEYVRTLGVYGFPWLAIAHSQTYYPILLQYADMTGVYGVTFWICIVNVVIYLLYIRVGSYVKENRVKKLVKDFYVYGCISSLILLFTVPVLYGFRVFKQNKWEGKTVKVSLLQGNVDMAVKSDAELRYPTFVLYDSLSREAAKSNPDLLVWPETAVLTWVKMDPEYDILLRKVVYETQIPLLTGAFDYEIMTKDEDSERYYKIYNAEVFYGDYYSSGEWYAKIRLVPFGEWFPYENYITVFRKLDFGEGNFTPGTTYTVFNLRLGPMRITPDTLSRDQIPDNSVRFSSVICFESVFSEFIQKFCNKGAQFLVVISNDNWFGRSSAHYQHAQISIFRAIENRIGVAVCSNSGMSVFIDPYGRVTASSSVFVREILTGAVHYRTQDSGTSFYTRYGEKFSQTVLIISILCIMGAVSLRKSAGGRPASGGKA